MMLGNKQFSLLSSLNQHTLLSHSPAGCLGGSASDCGLGFCLIHEPFLLGPAVLQAHSSRDEWQKHRRWSQTTWAHLKALFASFWLTAHRPKQVKGPAGPHGAKTLFLPWAGMGAAGEQRGKICWVRNKLAHEGWKARKQQTDTF